MGSNVKRKIPRELELALQEFPKIVRMNKKRGRREQKLIKECFDPLIKELKKRGLQ